MAIPHFVRVHRTTEQLLEFDHLREMVARFATSEPGRRFVLAFSPRMNRAQLETEFAQIRECLAYLRACSDLGFASLADPEGWLKRLASPSSVLSAGDLLDVASLLDTVASLHQAFRPIADQYPGLAERVAALGDFRPLAAAIRRAILPNGAISDDASPKLKRIRGSIGQTREKIQKSLEAILRARGEESGRDYITLRNDRFVIPVRTAERRTVPGVVHGASATGQTVFLEPLEAIELNNRLVQLAEDESAEIARILTELTERLRTERGALEFAADTIAEVDSLFARARYAREFDCAIPQFNGGRWLRLDSARNPVLQDTLHPQDRHVVPISLTLGADLGDRPGRAGTVMVISGPNTGGKTVTLKTVGLAALAAQSGLPVSAECAELPIFDRVLADIGDEQSITADLSTFSAHMLNLRSMVEMATERTLVLVDEIGTGTAPEEGAALAIALLEEFRARGSLTIATTHHDRLKAYASTTPGIVNAAVEFDEANLRPTYRLMLGVPGVSSGIEIARRLGLPEPIVQRARAEISPKAREARDLIAYLHRSRDEIEEIRSEAREEREKLEAERRALRTEWVERQRKRIADLEKKFAEATKQFETEVARLTAEIADRKTRAQIEKQSAKRLSKSEAAARGEIDAAVLEHLSSSQQDLGLTSEKPPTSSAEELSPGSRVGVRGMKQPVIFRRHDGRNAEVEAGPLRMRVPLNDLVALADGGAPAPTGDRSALHAGGKLQGSVTSGSGISVRLRPSEEPSADEINVIGCTVEEATRRVDKFLGAAALAAKPAIRIIHGHGTGALRRGLVEFLSTHPLVEGVRPEAEDRGGTAVTVVDLAR